MAAKRTPEASVNPNDETATGSANETSLVANEPKFSKAQILGSKWFRHRRDTLTALLKEDVRYTRAEVEKILNNFLKGKVD